MQNSKRPNSLLFSFLCTSLDVFYLEKGVGAEADDRAVGAEKDGVLEGAGAHRDNVGDGQQHGRGEKGLGSGRAQLSVPAPAPAKNAPVLQHRAAVPIP
jgi:hypothetical protein